MATSRTGLEAAPAARPQVDSAHESGFAHWADYARMAVLVVAILVSRLHLVPAVVGFDTIGLGAALIGVYPILREAIHDALARRMTMELSMTIALIGALSIREVFTADVIILFVLFAEMVEEMTMHRGHRAAEDLIGGLPETAERFSPAGTLEIAEVSDLKRGDMVLVRPGMRVPVDGEVTEGNSFVDQSAITGELEPVETSRGSMVFAGTVNRSSALQVRTDSPGSQTVFGRMLEAVKRAEESRAPVQKLADRLAGYLVYFALACALVTLIVTHNARSTISVIIVAGACGIAAGTPLAILGGLGRAARIGAIVKGGSYFEKLSTIDTIVFDKTGTLTAGNAEVVDIDPVPGFPPTELLRIAASAELYSEHPLARAIQRKTRGMEVNPPKEFAYHPGKGVTCLVNGRFTVVGSRAFLQEMGIHFDKATPNATALSHVSVAQSGRLLGSIYVADVLRSGAGKAISRLRGLGLRLVLMTGDSGTMANALAKTFRFDEVHADLLPDDKLDRLQALRADGHGVAMVGDGINDTPALAAADVPVAMGSGTDIAQEFAGVLLIGDDLRKLAELIELARRCRKIVLFNFAGTLLVDAAGIGLAAFGLLTPILAALIHVTSELFFILNSARLLPLRTQNNP
ncbi:MAG TPA: cation-translocating P-type ATPase [Bryobacteraceae bacterium]|nr:cation-translocating P-type ATPase [Bryobacteraceae bacterium]